MFDPGDLGRITADEQADALRTLIAVFATSVQRPGQPARNAVTAEILDILDEVPPRSTIFRQAIETALLARAYHGAATPDGEAAYLTAEHPTLAGIEAACGGLMERLDGVPETDRRAWITAEVIAAALVHAESDRRLGGPDRDVGDLAVAEFLMKAAAQYLAATARRGA